MRFHLLGPLSVHDDQQAELRIPQARQRSLLGVMLLHRNETIRTGRLAELLWGSSVPGTGHGALRTHVWALRRLLGPADRLRRTADGYRLEVRPGELDMDEFRYLADQGRLALAEQAPRRAAELLSQAVGLWREPPLTDIPATAEMAPRIQKLLTEREAARDALAGARLALGQHRELLGELRERVAEEPADERAWELLMIALYRCGRRAETLTVFARLQRILAGEYGIDPGPALLHLHQQVLADDPALSLQATGSYSFSRGA